MESIDDLKKQSVVVTLPHEFKEFYLYIDPKSLATHLLLVMVKRPILRSIFANGSEIFDAKPAIEDNNKTNSGDLPLSLHNLVFLYHDHKYNIYIFESFCPTFSHVAKELVPATIMDKFK